MPVLAFIARGTAVADADLVTVCPTISYGVPGCSCGFSFVGAPSAPSAAPSPVEKLVMMVRIREISVSPAVREAERDKLDMTSLSKMSFFWTAAFFRLSSATTIVFHISISAACFAMPF